MSPRPRRRREAVSQIAAAARATPTPSLPPGTPRPAPAARPGAAPPPRSAPTAAGREGLEAEVRCRAWGHGVGLDEDRRARGGRFVVPRPRHTGAGEQRYGGPLGLCQKGGEDPWVRGGAAFDIAARGREVDLG